MLKGLSAVTVVIGLLLSLVPVVAQFDDHSKGGNEAFFKEPIVSRILWPAVFMIGFVSACS